MSSEANQRLATAIKYLTQSTWSHAALYAGDLIEKAVGSDEAGLTRLNEAVETRTAYEVEYRLIWLDGSLHWINSPGSASYAPDGAALKMVGVTRRLGPFSDAATDNIQNRVEQGDRFERSCGRKTLLSGAMMDQVRPYAGCRPIVSSASKFARSR
jgi:PAS fold